MPVQVAFLYGAVTTDIHSQIVSMCAPPASNVCLAPVSRGSLPVCLVLQFVDWFGQPQLCLGWAMLSCPQPSG
jgi:hypothetical protein